MAITAQIHRIKNKIHRENPSRLKNLKLMIKKMSQPAVPMTSLLNDQKLHAVSTAYHTLDITLQTLPAASQQPIAVKPEDKLSVATAIMLTHNLSQLPVLRDKRHILGYISWKTIGEAQALGQACELVSDCTDARVIVLSASSPLTTAVQHIIDAQFIMVKDDKRHDCRSDHLARYFTSVLSHCASFRTYQANQTCYSDDS